MDQSNKIEDSGPTVIAFANGVDDAVVISSKTKTQKPSLGSRQSDTPKPLAYVLVFAASVFSCLSHIWISWTELSLILNTPVTTDASRVSYWRVSGAIDQNLTHGALSLERVGKGSAHDKANLVRRGKDTRRRIVSLDDLLEVLEK
ncbi:MAG: hypothetical protein R2844_23340 [Caldilineales bacterium]